MINYFLINGWSNLLSALPRSASSLFLPPSISCNSCCCGTRDMFQVLSAVYLRDCIRMLGSVHTEVSVLIGCIYNLHSEILQMLALVCLRVIRTYAMSCTAAGVQACRRACTQYNITTCGWHWSINLSRYRLSQVNAFTIQ